MGTTNTNGVICVQQLLPQCLVDPLDFILHYDVKPELYPLSSKQSLRRCSGLSESFKHGAENTCEVDNFLSGWSFCSSQNVSPPFADLCKLTELAGGHWMSDADLINRVRQKSTQKAVIITTTEEYESVITGPKERQRISQLLKNATLDKSISTPLRCAFSTMTKVPTDWFLQIIMNRKPPMWPVPTHHTIQ
ncbi:unnamed protein product [Trichobilharzia szidati]|nr:unnamed protein product [Trichobilharzia szidati]